MIEALVILSRIAAAIAEVLQKQQEQEKAEPSFSEADKKILADMRVKT